MRKRVSVLYAPGTNCEEETLGAFRLAGADPRLVYLKSITERKEKITDCDIFCFPGGFSYGDHVDTGVIVANFIQDFIPELIAKKIPIIGICNGFQIMVRAGMFGPDIALTQNDSGVFCSKEKVEHFVKISPCIWTKGLEKKILTFPSAHKCGKFVGTNSDISEVLYYENFSPNGGEVAGICSKNGLLLGVMDHPERPFGNRDGLKIFRNGVKAV